MEGKFSRALVIVMVVLTMGMIIDQIHAQGIKKNASEIHAQGMKKNASEIHESGQIFGIDKNNTIHFLKCYGKCFLKCNFPFPKPVKCAGICVPKCTVFRSELLDVHNYCNLGCATSKCTRISTATDARAEEVADCVNSCSVGCGKHH